MFHTHTTAQGPRAVCPPTGRRAIPVSSGRQMGQLQERLKRAYENFPSIGRYAPDLRFVFPMLMFLAEAAVAAHGFLLRPSLTRASDGEYEGDGLRNPDW